MAFTDNNTIITQTKKWVKDVVVGCNFCPFAAREVKRNTIYYKVIESATTQKILETSTSIFNHLDNDNAIETALLITPHNYTNFIDFLNIVDKVEKILQKKGYDGVYQIASFHPQYIFAGSNNIDAANYTNRSPYPMLHFIREESITRAVNSYPNINDVPNKNIAFAEEKGLEYMQKLLASCM
ncbi:MAG: DUF1415 domain-containing protein [Ferruginibacter sp.]|nr:DUF1415 domain-containing protein [Ferruginibacter sp.]